MTTLVLVRHATTAVTGRRLAGSTPGLHLDETGHEQAAAAARRLADVRIDAVYASPLERTQETARAIARPHGLRVRTRRELTEVDYGDWTGQPLGQLRRRKLWQAVQVTPSRVTFPGGESLRAAQARAVDALERLAADHARDTIVVVSHADIIRLAVAHFLAMPLDALQRLVVSPASVTTLHLADGGWPVLSRFNDTGGDDLAATGPDEADRRARTRR